MKPAVDHPQFNFAAQTTTPPPATRADVEWMMSELRGRGWRLASDLGAETESRKRRLRAIAKASKGQIISGQRGYHLTVEALHADYWHARDWLNSQADEMKSRVAEIDYVWHHRPQPRGDADAGKS